MRSCPSSASSFPACFRGRRILKFPVLGQHMNLQRIGVTTEQETPGIAVGMESLRRTLGMAPKERRARRSLGFCMVAILLACLGGCGRHHAPSTSGSAEAARAGEDPTPAVLAELTQLVRKYGAEQRQAPNGLDDLVTKGYLTSVPPAPNGKRFAINKRLEVYLADR